MLVEMGTFGIKLSVQQRSTQEFANRKEKKVSCLKWNCTVRWPVAVWL